MLDIGQKFVEFTKYQYQTEPSDQNKGLPQPPLADALPEGVAFIKLPKIEDCQVGSVDLLTAINRRVSTRKYDPKPLTLDELSYLLWCTQGVKQVTTRPATLRTVPSGGSRHPFETILFIQRVEGLRPGLYRYFALDHCIAELDCSKDWTETLTSVCRNQGMVRSSAVTFFWIAVTYRTICRYGARGYRDLYLDAGHVGQNLYLACEAMQAGCCAIGAYDDDLLSQYLQIDGVERFPIYVATVGKK
jgi:SagB-type dehydrogenase family enzyme